MKTGVVFDIQRFSVHDGPGIRTIIFLKGCPLKCLWCQNPEGISSSPQLLYYPNKCIGCGNCLDIINCNAVFMNKEGKVDIVWDNCIACGDCVDVCVNNAYEIAGKYMTIDEVVSEVKKDISYYRKSGGGVTLSGGDPLFQFDYTIKLLSRLKCNRIHTAIETSGYCDESRFEKIIDYVDLFLFDLKHIDSKMHKKYTGVNNDLIKNNLMKIVELKKEVIIRIPLIPGVNDSESIIRETAMFLKNNTNIKDIDIMPYHRLGVNKYISTGSEYELMHVEPQDREVVYGKLEIYKEYGFDVHVEGFIEKK